MSNLYCTVTNTSNILTVDTDASYGAITATATVECTSTSLDVGDAISIDLGYTTSHQVVFQGFVTKKRFDKPSKTYFLTCNDSLVKAVNNFLASDDQNQPLTYHNISDRDLVNDLLGKCGLSLSSGAVSPSFTFGTNSEGAKFNLQSVGDALQFICSVTGRVIYSTGGNIFYTNRVPYITGGDTSSHAFTTGSAGNILDISYEQSSDKIRNRVVVYGRGSLHSTASAGSPYLVVDQTAVIAHELLDTQALCDNTASVNLALMNRLGQIWTFSVVGDPTITALSIGDILESFTTPYDTNVFLYRVAHSFDETRYVTQITATA